MVRLVEGPEAAEENADVIGGVARHARLRPGRGIAGKGVDAEKDCDNQQNHSFRGENAHP